VPPTEQARLLLVATLGGLGVARDEAVRAADALQVERLTPGDFAAVARRYRVLGETPAAEAFIAVLREEVELKG
jgi:hypothetical protein